MYTLVLSPDHQTNSSTANPYKPHLWPHKHILAQKHTLWYSSIPITPLLRAPSLNYFKRIRRPGDALSPPSLSLSLSQSSPAPELNFTPRGLFARLDLSPCLSLSLITKDSEGRRSRCRAQAV